MLSGRDCNRLKFIKYNIGVKWQEASFSKEEIMDGGLNVCIHIKSIAMRNSTLSKCKHPVLVAISKALT